MIARDFVVDESLFLQHSPPLKVCKCPTNINKAPIAPSPDNTSALSSYSCFAGTFVLSGRGYMKVTSTSSATYLASLARAMWKQGHPDEPLRDEARRTALTATAFATFGAIVMFISLGIGYGDWLNAAETAASLALAIIPGEIELVLLVFSAMCSWKAARRGVAIRVKKALEALGSCSVLCLDYIGTITLGTVVLDTLYSKGQTFRLRRDLQSLDEYISNTEEIPEYFHEIIEYAILAGQRSPSEPLEATLKRLVVNKNVDSSRSHTNCLLT